MNIANSYVRKSGRKKYALHESPLVKVPVLLEREGIREHETLQSVADILNSEPLSMPQEDHEELLRLVKLWSEPDFDWRNYEFWRDKESPDSLRLAIDRAIDWSLMPGAGRRLHLIQAKSQGRSRETGKQRFSLAHFWFGKLALYANPEFWGGRCDRCQRFYVKNSLRQKRYCSDVCGHSKSSGESKKSKRTKKLATAQALFAEYSKLAPEKRLLIPWRQWIVKQRRAKKLLLSLTFLTQNEKDIRSVV